MKTDRQKRAVLYARKSLKQDKTEEQSASVADQLRRDRAYAEQHGMTVVGEFSDDGLSGLLDRTKRPGLDATLRMVENGEADVIVTLWTSRLSRKEEQRALIVSTFDKHGIEWHAVADGGRVDRKTFAGYLRYGVTTLFDDAYSIRVGENWRTAQANRIEAGLPKSHSPRFGYRYEFDVKKDGRRDNGRYVLHDAEAEVVRDMYRRYNRGDGFTRIVQWLTANGWKTTQGKPWSVRTLNRFMDNGFAAGFISQEADLRDLEDHKGAHEPLIEKTAWDAYVARRKKQAERGKGRPPGVSTRWWLAGFVKCGRCGSAMFIDSFTKETSSAKCSKRHGNPVDCGGMGILRVYVENAVGLWLGGHLDVLDQLAQVEAREVENASATVYHDAVAEQERLTHLLAALELEQLDPNKARDAAVFHVMKTSLNGDLNAARAKAEQAAADMAKPQADTDSVREGMEKGWDADHLAALRAVLDRVEVHAGGVTIYPVTGGGVSLLRKAMHPRCKVDGCDNRERTKGLCTSHVMRARNLGILDELARRVAESVEAPGPTINVEQVDALFASVSV